MLKKLFKSRTNIEYQPSGKIINEILHQRGNVNSIYPSDFSANNIQEIEKVRPYTMTSIERLLCLSNAVEHICKNKIEGDIVECGVWKGGSMMLVASKLMSLGEINRKLFLFDTYEGMSAPTEFDKTFNKQDAKILLEKESNKENGDNIWCYSSIEEVKNNLYSIGYEKNNLIFIKGKVEDTLPYKEIKEIALLRLDTDWYESTKHELETLYEKLVIGGILIIDDYGHWSGAKKAVDEFIENRKLNLFLNRVDYTCRLAIKTC
jgi:O-methyltransferase